MRRRVPPAQPATGNVAGQQVSLRFVGCVCQQLRQVYKQTLGTEILAVALVNCTP
jgi:hypothetical protein